MAARDSPEQLAHSFDTLAVALYWSKRASLALAEQSLAAARSALVEWLLEPIKLAAKRRGGAHGLGGSSLPARLPAAAFVRSRPPAVLPENQELVVLFACALLKTPGLLQNRPKAADGKGAEPFARADARVASRFAMLQFSPERFAWAAYPALYDVSDPRTFGDPLPLVEASWQALPPVEVRVRALRRRR
jgi:hypothetical protein